MSKIEVDAITEQSGTTLTVGGGACKTATVDATTVTLGRSGGTVSLASGATQSGFGRTGTVDWITTKKTSDFTAANGEGYFVDTGSGAVTVTLPGSPSPTNIVSVSDYNGTAGTNTITIARNGSNINGDASNFEINKEDSAITFVYVDATVGWTSVQTSNTADATSPFIAATGGTVTTCGNCKIHTFTGPGTFCVSCAGIGCNSIVSHLVIAGGGAGATKKGGSDSYASGGGGAGGYREVKNPVTPYTASPLDGYSTPANRVTVTVTSFPITVGAGGASVPTPSSAIGNNGSNSIFSTITSAGGGGGGNGGVPGLGAGAGGSGGGAGGRGSNPAGNGNTPPVSPAQGFNGGVGSCSGPTGGGGGGGATEVGQIGGPGGAGSGIGGVGGAGATTSISGSAVIRAGGGSGAGGYPATNGNPNPNAGGGGVPGGGGAGGYTNPGSGGAGTTNTGGGGGGAGSTTCSCNPGGSGGSGIVVIRYKFQ